MILDTINWNEIWNKDKSSNLISFSEKTEEKRWDTIAPLFREWMEVDDYPAKLMSRIDLSSDSSVLDIGCGTGTVTIAAAKRAKYVTALDISGKMLEIVSMDAKQKQLSNIRCLHSSWQDIRIGTDILPHDIVIASRAISRTGDLKESLSKIHNAALKYAYVTAWGGIERGLHRGLLESVGREYQNTTDYVYVFNILNQMNIRPNVEQIECTSTTIYPSLEEAVRAYSTSLNLSPEDMQPVRQYLEDHLIRLDNDQFLVPDTKQVWSLIWWKKE